MYWQVYLHKTVVSADCILISALNRAKHILNSGIDFECSKPLKFFLANNYTLSDFDTNSNVLEQFALMDDYDIISAIKSWTDNNDFILSTLSKKLINRNLNRILISNTPFAESNIDNIIRKISEQYNIPNQDAKWFVSTGKLENHAYDFQDQEIKILFKSKSCNDISIASDQLDRHFLEKSVTKYYISFPKEFNI
jgi:HD superfamily phosphohydrolase